MALKKYDVLFWCSLLLAIWFAATSAAWTYLANVFLSFPFGIISLMLWNSGRKNDPRAKRYAITGWVLVIGAAISLIALACFLLFG